MSRHEMRSPKPCRQWQLGTMHPRSRNDRRLPTAIEALVRVSATLKRRRPLRATTGANKAVGPTTLQQKGRAACLVGKLLLKLRKRSTPGHGTSRLGRLRRRLTDDDIPYLDPPGTAGYAFPTLVVRRRVLLEI